MTLTGLLDAKLVDYVQLNPVEYLKLISRHKAAVEALNALGLTPHLAQFSPEGEHMGLQVHAWFPFLET